MIPLGTYLELYSQENAQADKAWYMFFEIALTSFFMTRKDSSRVVGGL